MKSINKWKKIHPILDEITSSNDIPILLGDILPQIPQLYLLEKAIPYNGLAFTRQAIIKRDKLKKSKGNNINISMFPNLLRNTKVNNDMLSPLVRLLFKVKEGGC